MSAKAGQIKVNTSDIFPIIKKWLYSEHDIFLRELVSNATDAITKRGTLSRSQNLEIPKGKVLVSVDKEKKIIQIEDNGIGMTENEVEKYIAQLAFSGAEEFIEKMTKEGETSDIIGKFGLGFYSAFMVAHKVEVDSLSMNPGSQPIKWTCLGDVDYEFSVSDKKDVGTTITLHINQDSEDFLDFYTLRKTLKNFCDFMPYDILLLDENKAPEYPKKEDGTEDKSKEPFPVKPELINQIEPLWKKDPQTLNKDDYLNFFGKIFPLDSPPLFWIHLKVDHPFMLEGILYFPKLDPNKPFNENNIKLYSKQVFVSDNVKNIIPEFLSLLKGIIDSTDIPLNVSRSSLQGDPNIKKISNYIIKKVAESLKKLYRTDRERFEEIWQDIGLFVKYGSVSDSKFDELIREMVIFNNSEGKYITLNEYTESIPEEKKDALKNKVIYFEKDKSDYSLRRQLLDEGIQAIEIDDHIDPHYIQHVENHKITGKEYHFSSVDNVFADLLNSEKTSAEDMRLKDIFSGFLGPEKSGENKDDKSEANFEVEIKNMKNSKTPAFFKIDEQMKRFSKMAKSMGQNSGFPIKKTLVINPNNPLIKNALKLHDSGNESLVKKICKHVEDLANISSEGLSGQEKDHFVTRSQDLIQELSEKLVK